MFGNPIKGLECPNCQEHVEKYCNGNHRVIERLNGEIMCEFCGGRRVEGELGGIHWIYKCGCCGDIVPTGKLRGLFIPHLCASCHDKAIQADRARGNFCYKCRRVYAQCCC